MNTWRALRAAFGPRRTATWVYFVRAGQYVKIGRAVDLQRRFDNLQVSNPLKLELLAAIPTMVEAERIMHARFAEDHVRGEWHRVSARILEFARAQPRVSLRSTTKPSRASVTDLVIAALADVTDRACERLARADGEAGAISKRARTRDPSHASRAQLARFAYRGGSGEHVELTRNRSGESMTLRIFMTGVVCAVASLSCEAETVSYQWRVVTLPDGKLGAAVICHHDMGSCYERAGRACSHGYDILDKEGHAQVIESGSAYGARARWESEAVYSGVLLIRCH